MKVSYEWLKEITGIKEDARIIADTITMHGLEVEKIENYGIGKADIVTVQIKEVKRHPDADNLLITKADAGRFGLLQIITNVKNIKEGQKVLAALDGTKLATGLQIKKTKLKGVESEGMYVGWEEIGAQYKSEGLFNLEKDISNGTNYSEILPVNDSVINIELTANRGDCLSMLGVSREIRTIFNTELKEFETDYKTNDKNTLDLFKVEIKSENCFRYCGGIILDVEIKPSPYWMQLRLIKAGVRPISNVVDITNYVMLECNQPLHAFDMDKINKSTIIVRDASIKEKLTTLDDIERTLDSDDMVIADPVIPHCMAGVMGGQISEVSDSTKNVFLEAAYFKPETIRKTSKKTGLRSESSYRFERGIDIERVDWSLKRALFWFDKLKVGKVCKGIIDVYPRKKEKIQINTTTDWIINKLGTEVKDDEIVNIIKRLGFEVNKDKNNLSIKVPSWRNDIEIKEDIAEEVARIHGYNNIKVTYFPSIGAGIRSPFQKFEKDLRNLLYRLGCDEVMNFSFYGKSLFNKMLLTEDHKFRNTINLEEPLTDEWAGMRNSLIPGMIKTASFNYTHQNKNLNIFEIGNVSFDNKGKFPLEEKKLAVLLAGNKYDKDHTSAEIKYDYFDIKGITDAICNYCKINPEFKSSNEVFYHPYQQSKIFTENIELGSFGKIHPGVCESFDIQVDCYLIELSINKLFDCYNSAIRYSEIPVFPSSKRDIAIVIDENVYSDMIINAINESNIKILQDIKVFDVFKGGNIEQGKYSLALSLIFNKITATLIDSEVDDAVKKILNNLEKKFNAKIR
ncbi:MAG: phenylalanine--tRNA ligase subunit beta [Spirochaetes bacterium]|nr:phenylalanine--tRNA ligase subunit beta [Spirochaetota bacterium]